VRVDLSSVKVEDVETGEEGVESCEDIVFIMVYGVKNLVYAEAR